MPSETMVQCFISLVSTLNFTKTASNLYLSQQAVSKNISNMEKELGFPLFVRTPHSVNLTESGLKFHAALKSFRKEIDDICSNFVKNQNHIQMGVTNKFDAVVCQFPRQGDNDIVISVQVAAPRVLFLQAFPSDDRYCVDNRSVSAHWT